MFLTIYYLLALVIILTVHEAAHAWVAMRLGDPTAERMGRVSLNPLRHLDLLGTMMLFLAGFGWGKPVPVNPRNFKKPVRDEALTAFAGPLANLIMAVLAAIPVSYISPDTGMNGLLTFSSAILDLSLVLFLFNMLPFPPLDGSKFVVIFVPHRFQKKYQELLRKGMPYFLAFIVIDLYFLKNLIGFSFVWSVVSAATFWLKTAILVVV
ncbi:site-2 protease family protein [Candidatus Peregrinibacteria bacterium]|jgi:Zn-dependent protease|nr:site-2 protease family protein [Candidatus Peregrinibacteria bacterium]MBT4631738.1 site-2 protease family protein [Candidatus Peregrinibacteria bacterium]MBT5517252.1 site-2 protease family protein [Candidatus Peregrinibacteria bacterium]MBT5824537.1 site-2 protease family protein [Candidatus Peregrinibacteria bacterium]